MSGAKPVVVHKKDIKNFTLQNTNLFKLETIFLGKMEKDEKQKKMQQAYLELQMVNQQIKQNQQQMRAIEEQMIDLHLTIESLNELKNTKKGSKILVPLSSGIYTKADLKDNKELIVNVGAGTAVKKDIDDTGKLLGEQLNNLKDMQKQIISNTEQLGLKAVSIEKRMEEFVSGKG